MGTMGSGGVVSAQFERAFCYEISDRGRDQIRKNAEINGVSSKVDVRGKANSWFHEEFSEQDSEESVLFADIEGEEFSVFTPQVFKKFKNSIIFIEIHRWVENFDQKIEVLRQFAEEHFKVSTLTTTSRDLSAFKELEAMSDSDRW
jgi:hypothetical protein